jgi:formate dehydrogenase (coenzyme F420) beta subunit
MENSIVKTVKQLFADKKVDLVIGYKKGSVDFMNSPVFIENPDDADELVFDPFCKTNLAVYLPGIFQKNIKDKKTVKVGVIAKGCDARSCLNLVLENQVPRENVTIIGVPCMGMIDNKKLSKAVPGHIVSFSIEKDDVSVKLKDGSFKKVRIKDLLEQSCEECQYPMHDAADIKIEGKAKDGPGARYRRVTDFEARTIEERMEYFKKEISKCIRCNACRQACPNCYCKTCFSDQTKPRWIGISDKLSDTMVFHLVRMFHQAGRCVGCDACARACPQGVDLRLFTQKLVKDVEELYGFVPGISENALPPLCEYKEGDYQGFITEP